MKNNLLLNENKKKRMQYWNKCAYLQDSTTPFPKERFLKYIEQDHIILDYGCGYGRILKHLKENNYCKLHGVDNSGKMIERGKNFLPEFSFIQNKEVNIPYSDDFFDSVLLFGVLTCVTSDEEQHTLLSEIKRILKPNGIIHITDFLLNADERNINRYNLCKEKYNQTLPYGVFEMSDDFSDSPVLFRHQREDSLTSLLMPFETLEYVEQVFTTLHGNPGNGFHYFGKLVKTD